jgi:hypothetical protein
MRAQRNYKWDGLIHRPTRRFVSLEHHGLVWPMRAQRNYKWDGLIHRPTRRFVSLEHHGLVWPMRAQRNYKWDGLIHWPTRRLVSLEHHGLVWPMRAPRNCQWKCWVTTVMYLREGLCPFWASHITLTNESTEKGPMRMWVSNTYRKIRVLCSEGIVDFSDQWEHRERTNEKVG